MREIKFRAWDKKEKRFSYFELPRFNGSWDCQLLDKEIQQFTGLFDKNGKAIWEGDVIKREGEAMLPELILKVFFNEKIACFQVGDWTIGHFISDNKIEVIGNIYENSEK